MRLVVQFEKNFCIFSALELQHVSETMTWFHNVSDLLVDEVNHRMERYGGSLQELHEALLKESQKKKTEAEKKPK